MLCSWRSSGSCRAGLAGQYAGDLNSFELHFRPLTQRRAVTNDAPGNCSDASTTGHAREGCEEQGPGNVGFISVISFAKSGRHMIHIYSYSLCLTRLTSDSGIRIRRRRLPSLPRTRPMAELEEKHVRAWEEMDGEGPLATQ